MAKQSQWDDTRSSGEFATHDDAEASSGRQTCGIGRPRGLTDRPRRAGNRRIGHQVLDARPALGTRIGEVYEPFLTRARRLVA